MNLLSHFFSLKNINRQKGKGIIVMGKVLSVEEAENTVYSALETFTGWKFLKSRRCLKKKVKDLEFRIHFFSSKWNKSYEYTGINAGFTIVYKKPGKLPVQNTAAYYEYHPRTGDDLYWYDISTDEKCREVIEILKNEVRNTALDIVNGFENNREEAVRDLLENHFDEYHVRLEFAADILGAEAVMPRIQTIVSSLTDEEKQEITDYRNGMRNKTWMLNPCSMKYIADHYPDILK